MKNYFKNWSFIRLLRLSMGIFVMVQGVKSEQWLFVILGGLFSLMPLLNIGCCRTSGCNTTVSQSNKKMEDITYEEIK